MYITETARTIGNEIHKGLLLAWSYRVNFIVEVTIFTGIFSLLSFIMGDMDTGRFENRASYFIGFMLFSYIMDGLSNMGYGVREETVTGTFEQMSMGPTPSLMLLIGRVGASFIVRTVMNVLMGIILIIAFDIDLPLRWEGVPIFILTLGSLYSMGFMIAGLTVVFKRIEMFGNMLANLIVIVNGTFVAVDKFAGGVETATRLVPTTQGLIVLRRVMLEDTSLVTVWNDGSLIVLILHTLAFLTLGVLIFQWCTRVARQQGTLAHY